MNEENHQTDSASADQTARLYPPLQVWKVGLLLVVTFSMYSMFWLYRTAKDMRAIGNSTLTPALWWMAPFTIISAAIAAGRLSSMIEKWADREDVKKTTLFNPTLVVLTILVAYLCFSVYELFPIVSWLWIPGFFIIIVPFLIMQGQLNAIKSTVNPEQFRSGPMQYTGLQQTAVAVFGLVFVCVVAALTLSFNEHTNALPMAVGTVLHDKKGRFELEVVVDGWKQVDPAEQSEDGDMEFVANWADGDWGVVFMMDDTNMDQRTETRVKWIHEDYPKAKCQEKRHFDEQASTVIGTLECSGANSVDGHYQFRSTVVATEELAVEIIMFISAERKRVFETRKPLLNLSEGLRLL